MTSIDLNCDLGESFGAYTLGMDERILPHISSANVACGFHAGDPMTMAHTVALCKANGVAVGAHPGFPDLVGFGRRNMAVTPAQAKADIQYQVGALYAFCRAQGVALHHVKPHGALYNMAARDMALALAICEAIYQIDPALPILALSGSRMIEAAEQTGLPYISEVFADRNYLPDGTLVPRSSADALIRDETVAVSRVIRMAREGRVTAVDGSEISLCAQSVCVHGDGEKALAFTRKIRAALLENGIAVTPALMG